MHSKILVSLLLVNFVLLTLIPLPLLAENVLWWDDERSYRQEIIIPFDTSTDLAKYQPIDIQIEFENPCWAKNEQEHSIRVIFQYGDTLLELDSQIYKLEYSDETHIKSCGLVFLIPEEANGKEQYYIYYDDSEKNPPNYIDHVGVEESYYRHEPISGYPLTSQYYKITQDEYVIYAVSQEGELMGYHTSQHVTKMKDKTTEVRPKNGELFAAFHFEYFYDQGLFDYSATSQALVSKEVLVDGNLMVEFGIVSTSKRDDVQTTAVYKYYYCPSENTRIHTHVKHEALKELYVDEGINTDGTYAVLQCGGISSSSIKDFNFGEIPPYLHVYTEHDIIEEYPLDPDPEYIPEDPDIRVLSTEDDVDAGVKTWASFDYGETGISHAVIFSSNSVLQLGTDERDGIQVKAHEMDYPHLPGIENNMATLFFGRNSYEAGDEHDRVIPDDFVVEFDAEFFSSKTGGYSIISEETEIFQKLVELKPSYDEEFDEETEETEGYKLTVFVHLAPSIPMGSAFSVLSGRNLSYVSAELYKEDEFIISGAMGRLLLKPLPDLSEANMIEQIVTVFSSFDYRNLSFVKKICFQNLQPGRYVVKIYKENTFFGRERKYVGFQIIDVKDDTKTRIFCRPEGSIQVSVVDQNDAGVADANVVLLSDDVAVAQGITDEQGRASITVPVHLRKSYDLRVYYNGFIVYEDDVRLPYRRSIIPIKTPVDIQRYSFALTVHDTWGFVPEIKLTPMLTSSAMDEPTTLSTEKQAGGWYLFTNLPPALYQLTLQYKSFTVQKDIQIPSEDVDIVFPAEFFIKINILDSRGTVVKDVKVIISRGGKEVERQSNSSGVTFLLPPGAYTVKVYNENDLIGARKINVFSQRSFDIITATEPVFSLLVTVSAVVFALIGLIFTYIKKDILYFLKILAVSLVLIAVVSPWWMLQGSTTSVETSTTMYLTPLELITTTTSVDVISGELAFLPELFIDVVSLIPLFSALACLFILSSIYFKKRGTKLYLSLQLLTIFILIGSILIFSIGMSALAEVGIGSFIGERNLEVSIPGEEVAATVLCSWGPNVGFYLYVISIIMIALIIIYDVKKIVKKRR